MFILRGVVNNRGLTHREISCSWTKPNGIHAHTFTCALEYRARPPWCRMLYWPLLCLNCDKHLIHQPWAASERWILCALGAAGVGWEQGSAPAPGGLCQAQEGALEQVGWLENHWVWPHPLVSFFLAGTEWCLLCSSQLRWSSLLLCMQSFASDTEKRTNLHKWNMHLVTSTCLG